MGRLRRPFMPRTAIPSIIFLFKDRDSPCGARGGFSFCMMIFKAESPQPMAQRHRQLKRVRLDTHFIFSSRNSPSPKARIAEALRKTWALWRRGSAGLRRNFSLLLQEPRGTPGEAPLAFSSTQPKGGSASGGKAGAIERRRTLGEFRNNGEVASR